MYLNLLLLIVLLLGCSSNSEPLANNVKLKDCEIEEVLIKPVDFSVQTFIRVECDSFETYFDKKDVSARITDNATIKEFAGEISKLEKDSTGYHLDTRAKVIIVYNRGANDTLCIRKFSMLLNGKEVKYSNELKSLVLERVGHSTTK